MTDVQLTITDKINETISRNQAKLDRKKNSTVLGMTLSPAQIKKKEA